MRELIKRIIPEFIIRFYKTLKKNKRAKDREKLKSSGVVVSQILIENKLSELGINPGEVVMLHSSLSKIGFVEGGANAVINAFLKVLGSGGTLVMPSFPAEGFNFDYLIANPVFDVRNTISKTGIISETFRKMHGVKRSLHPTEPVVAFGPQAEFLTNSHFNQITPYNSNSPFYKLCKLNAKIVLLGVDFNSLTNLHTVEDDVENFKFPVYHEKIFELELINESAEKCKVKTKVHDPKWSKQRKCNDFIPMFSAAGFMSEGKLGNATVYVINSNAMHQWMLEMYKEKGITMYTPQGS